MSVVGRLCALAAVVIAVGTVAFWNGEPSTVSTSSLDGAALFRAKGCASCHDGPDSIASVDGFPPLVDATDWAGQRRPGMTARDYLAESITAPSAFVPPTFSGGNGPATAMPSLTITADELEVLIDYLLSE